MIAAQIFATLAIVAAFVGFTADAANYPYPWNDKRLTALSEIAGAVFLISVPAFLITLIWRM